MKASYTTYMTRGVRRKISGTLSDAGNQWCITEVSAEGKQTRTYIAKWYAEWVQDWKVVK